MLLMMPSYAMWSSSTTMRSLGVWNIAPPLATKPA
jgi:hypothetical protein